MGWLKNMIKEDMEAVRSLQGIKIYYDKKKDIFMSEVRNKPNKYVPQTTRICLVDDLTLVESTNGIPTLMENFFKGDKKLIEKDKNWVLDY